MKAAVSFISLILAIGTLIPSTARAWGLGDFFASVFVNADSKTEDTPPEKTGVQTMKIPEPAKNFDPTAARGGGGITIDDSALVPEEGPSGTIADIEKPLNGQISLYVVQKGDTLSGIAKLFNVTPGTILSANDLGSKSVIKPGDKLVILPITGIPYVVGKNDTLESIAKAYGADAAEIASYNNIENKTLIEKTHIIIPNGEAVITKAPEKPTKTVAKAPVTKKVMTSSYASGDIIPDANNPAEPSHNVGPAGTDSQVNYYISPLSSYKQSQGIHGYNAVDLAAPKGTPIMASAAGTVVVAREGSWNGGYGSYVVISHSNGAQTLYAHMSSVAAYDGETVVQGQVIGYVGKTGQATGYHLHFEIRNGIRNPF